MLVLFPPIFVADTKVIYGYNFVAPLKYLKIFLIPIRPFTQSFNIPI